jgi:hypothetical protein
LKRRELLALPLLCCSSTDPDLSKAPVMATLKKNIPYRFTVRFEPPLSTLAQFRQLAKLMTNPVSALVGVTPKAGVLVHSFTMDVTNVVAGREWFTLGGQDPNGKVAPQGPVSSVIIQKITIEKVYR